MKNDDFYAFYKCCEKNINHPMFLKQKHYFHHHQVSVYEHVILVAYHVYKTAKRLHLNAEDLVCGALLHDFFLYDWHIEGKTKKKRLFKKHGFTHAKQAAFNADIYFSLSAIEKDIIKKHMFPLNLSAPVFIESWLVNLLDSYVTFKEYFTDQEALRQALVSYIDNQTKRD